MTPTSRSDEPLLGSPTCPHCSDPRSAYVEQRLAAFLAPAGLAARAADPGSSSSLPACSIPIISLRPGCVGVVPRPRRMAPPTRSRSATSRRRIASERILVTRDTRGLGCVAAPLGARRSRPPACSSSTSTPAPHGPAYGGPSCADRGRARSADLFDRRRADAAARRRSSNTGDDARSARSTRCGPSPEQQIRDRDPDDLFASSRR